MTITSPTRQRRPVATRLALVTAASLGLIAGPIAVAAPTAAAPSDKVNCWVTAKAPDRVSGNQKFARVDFSFKIDCDKNVKVKFRQWIYQKDGKGYDRIAYRDGDVRVHKNHDAHKNTRVHVYDKDRKSDHEKVYHVVKITWDKDKDRYGKWSKGSDRDKSKEVKIYFRK